MVGRGMFGRAGSDGWRGAAQLVNNPRAAVWDVFLVFFFLKGGVSLPRFVSEEKKDKCVSNMLLVSL